MAAVWEAEDKVLTRRVAIKVLHPHLAGDDGFRTRFRREAVAAARLAHPHIVTTYDTGRDAEVAYIVMELVEGTTLARLLKSSGPLPVAKAIDVAVQVADALACAHTHGVVHRDVKPANILLRQDGHVKVADFGIAKAGAGNDLTRTGVVMGTAKYLSPEQVSGSPAEASSDIYALGIVLYEMICGAPPFVGDTELSTAVARLTGSPGSLRERREDVPRSLEAVVLRSLARDPAARFQSAEEMRASLMAVDSDNDEATPPAGLTLTSASPRRGIPRMLVAGLAALLFLSVAVIIRSGDGGGSSNDAARKAGLAAPAGPLAEPKALPAASFDPYGDDKSENQATVGNVADSDPATVWKTSSYQDNFPKLKPGVGVYLDLGRNQRVRSVKVAATNGYTAEIYVADRPSADLAGWGRPRAAGGSGTFDVGGVTGRYVLVWFTSLPQVDGGYKVEVSEITPDYS
ncbi:MAG: eukaryotic-like serine/threonine-protein kinase [Actinomycetota bacterium]|jgi:serine/threonine-protein kinase|nr:eukaryotic-like serine/threonine-protein kinase [Actinomycetota bacterium]